MLDIVVEPEKIPLCFDCLIGFNTKETVCSRQTKPRHGETTNAPMANKPPDASAVFWLCVNSKSFRFMVSSQILAEASEDISATSVDTYQKIEQV